MKQYKREEIEFGVRKAVARVFLYGDLDEVKLDCLISDLCGFDSQSCYYIGLRITVEFGIGIPDNEATAFAGWTVSELCDYVEERLKEQKSQ